jgi:hypothetical protein
MDLSVEMDSLPLMLKLLGSRSRAKSVCVGLKLLNLSTIGHSNVKLLGFLGKSVRYWWILLTLGVSDA